MKNKIISLETIQFQNTNFLDDISMLIKYVRNIYIPDSKFFQSNQFIDLEKCIFKYTGIKVTFEGCTYGMAVYVPNVNKNSIFNNEFKKYIYEKDDTLEKSISKLNESSELKGYINLKTAKVSGIFSSITNRILINRRLLNNPKFTDYELSSCILHEIGHVFTWLEYSSRTCSTNQVLSLLNRTIGDNKESKEDIEFIYKKIKKSNLLTEEELSSIRKTNNKENIQIVVMNSAIRKSVSELGYSLYDSTSSEQLADQFATRFGAGKHVVTALYKLDGLNAITPIPLLINTSLSLLLIGPIYTGAILFGFIISNTLYNGDIKIYDSPKSRILRIRHQNTERLKNSFITDTEKEYYLDQNKNIDLLSIKINEDIEVINIIIRTFNKNRGMQYDSQLLQKDLESIAFNQLFDKSAELSLLTKELK